MDAQSLDFNLVHKVLLDMHISTARSDYEDYFQTGAIGLVKALRLYNPEKKTKFSTYAYKSIKNNISNFYYDNQLIKFKSQQTQDFKFTEIEELRNLSDDNQENPYIDDIYLKRVERIKHILKTPECYNLLLDLMTQKRWSESEVKDLQIKFCDYNGYGALMLSNGNILGLKAYLLQKIKLQLGKIKYSYKYKCKRTIKNT